MMTKMEMNEGRVVIESSSRPNATAQNALHECAVFVNNLDELLPPDLAERAGACLFYALGTGVLCIEEPYGSIAEASVVAMDGVGAESPAATALGSGRRLRPSAAAFCNAVMFHGRCQEDTYESAHLGIAVVPPVLALVEAGIAPPSSLIPSIVAGYEVGGALARMFNKATSSYGLRASPLYGTFAAAAASAKAMRLSVTQTASALAHAAAFTGGTLQAIADGTDEWRYQMGVAVRRGMEAAALAKAGALGSQDALEGRHGFAHVYARRALQAPLGLGMNWALPNVAFKPYPICARNQTPVILATQIRKSVPPQSIAKIHLRISDHILNGMLERRPKSISSALMSTYFCVATALLKGKISLNLLADFEDADVEAMISRIEIEPHESVQYPDVFAEVKTITGQTLTFQEKRSMASFAFSGSVLLDLLKKTALDHGMEPSIMDRLYRHSYSAKPTSVDPILEVFQEARTQGI